MSLLNTKNTSNTLNTQQNTQNPQNPQNKTHLDDKERMPLIYTGTPDFVIHNKQSNQSNQSNQSMRSNADGLHQKKFTFDLTKKP